MKIEIKCTGSTEIKPKLLKAFQGDLKRLSKDSYEKLKHQIIDLGFSEPISVWQNEGINYILNGHQRVKAVNKMIKEGYKLDNGLPCNLVEADDLKTAKKKVLALTSQFGEMTNDSLLDYIKDAGINIDEVSTYQFPEIDMSIIEDALSTDEVGQLERDSIEDEVPEVQDSSVSLGDIWLLGNHRLMCGDSTDKDTVDKLMDGEKADMVFTDPPYGVSYQSRRRTKSKKFEHIVNDDSINADWLPIAIQYSYGFVYIWTNWKVLIQWIPLLNRQTNLTNMIIWNKGQGGLGDLDRTFSSDFEIALVSNRGNSLIGKRLGSVWSINKDAPIKYIHPTQKPVFLAETAIEASCKGNVLDLFGGSGSTLIACEKTNRKCYMMEIDPHYCQVIIDRWEKYTSKEAYKHEN